MGYLPKTYVCRRTDGPFPLDGRLDKPAWRAAAWTDDFLDIEGDARPRPRFRTRAKMLWDETCFYIGAEMEEPHIWATLTEHDSVIFQDNDFEVFIDPDGDNHDYYEIEINALNTVWDLRLVKPYRDGGPALNEWEIPGWRSAVHIDGTLNDPRDTDRGWSLEMAIPWKALGEFARRPAPPRDGDQWRVNFSRVEWDVAVEDGRYVKVPARPEHNWVWSPQGVVDMHQPEHWGVVQFSADPSGAAAYRPDPTRPIRDYLMAVYHAQRRHQEARGIWAETLAALELPLAVPDVLIAPPAMRMTEAGYEVTAECRDARLHVREDSRLWKE